MAFTKPNSKKMHRTRFLVLFLLLFLPTVLFGQFFRFGVPNLQAYDKQRFHFGFSLGIDIVDVNLKTKSDYEFLYKNSGSDPGDTVNVREIYSKAQPAFNVGIVANMRLGEHFDLRFIPSFSISNDIHLQYVLDDKIVYQVSQIKSVSDSIVRRVINCNSIIFPLLIKFKSSRMHNIRMYAIAGAEVCVYMFGKSAKSSYFGGKDYNMDIIPIINTLDLRISGGFGFDFYTANFKLSTEFKMNFGVRSQLKTIDNDNPNEYKTSPVITGIKSLKSKTFTISFIFE